MTKEESLQLIQNRLKNEPEFKKAYDAYLGNLKTEGKISDDNLENVSGGFFGIEMCPKCKNHSLTTFTFGIYAACTTEGCDYTEWFI